MRVFVAGATGVIGRRLVPLLARGRPRGHGHDPLARARRRPCASAAHGPAVADALDAGAVREAVGQARPGGHRPPAHRHPGRAQPAPLRPSRWRATTACAWRARATSSRRRRSAHRRPERRLRLPPDGGRAVDRGGPAVPRRARAVQALGRRPGRASSSQVAERGGRRAALRLLLRPGHGLRQRRRRWPTWSASGGCRSSAAAGRTWSFIHVDDAARATLAAIDPDVEARRLQRRRRRPGSRARVDPRLRPGARGARAARVPTWLARVAAGEFGVYFMTGSRAPRTPRRGSSSSWEPADPLVAADGLAPRRRVVGRADPSVSA